jgi:Ca2+-binding RTX toxin-like protein
MTGAATLFLTGTAVSTVSTGSGADSLTLDVASATGFILDTGAGNDTLELEDTDTNVTIDGGEGTDTVQMQASINLTGQTFALTNVEVLDLDSAGAVNTLTVDSGDISGDSYAVKSSNGVDTLTVTADTATVDLSGLSVDAATVTMVINADTFTGVSAVTITGTNDADDIDMAGGVGSTAFGGGGVDNILGGAGADTIDGGAGGDTLGGAGGADTITGGAGADTITAGNGADTINLAETTAARDIVVTTSTLTAKDTINDFAAGSAATTDEVDIDISDVTALATQLVNLDDTANHAGIAGNAITSTVTAAFDGGNLTANTDILILGGALTFSSGAALAEALEDGGAAEFTLGGAAAIGDVFMVLYSDGTNTHLSAVEAVGAALDNGTFADGELLANDILTFSGIADATDFAATNFDFIA